MRLKSPAHPVEPDAAKPLVSADPVAAGDSKGPADQSTAIVDPVSAWASKPPPQLVPCTALGVSSRMSTLGSSDLTLVVADSGTAALHTAAAAAAAAGGSCWAEPDQEVEALMQDNQRAADVSIAAAGPQGDVKVARSTTPKQLELHARPVSALSSCSAADFCRADSASEQDQLQRQGSSCSITAAAAAAAGSGSPRAQRSRSRLSVQVPASPVLEEGLLTSSSNNCTPQPQQEQQQQEQQQQQPMQPRCVLGRWWQRCAVDSASEQEYDLQTLAASGNGTQQASPGSGQLLPDGPPPSRAAGPPAAPAAAGGGGNIRRRSSCDTIGAAARGEAAPPRPARRVSFSMPRSAPGDSELQGVAWSAAAAALAAATPSSSTGQSSPPPPWAGWSVIPVSNLADLPEHSELSSTALAAAEARPSLPAVASAPAATGSATPSPAIGILQLSPAAAGSSYPNSSESLALLATCSVDRNSIDRNSLDRSSGRLVPISPGPPGRHPCGRRPSRLLLSPAAPDSQDKRMVLMSIPKSPRRSLSRSSSQMLDPQGPWSGRPSFDAGMLTSRESSFTRSSWRQPTPRMASSMPRAAAGMWSGAFDGGAPDAGGAEGSTEETVAGTAARLLALQVGDSKEQQQEQADDQQPLPADVEQLLQRRQREFDDQQQQQLQKQIQQLLQMSSMEGDELPQVDQQEEARQQQQPVPEGGMAQLVRELSLATSLTLSVSAAGAPLPSTTGLAPAGEFPLPLGVPDAMVASPLASITDSEEGSEEWWCGEFTGLSVKDVMTPGILSISQDAEAEAALVLMKQQELPALLVDCGPGQAPGFISPGDFVKMSLKRKRRKKVLVKDVMSHPVITVEADMAIEECAVFLHERRVKRAVVVEQQQEEGQEGAQPQQQQQHLAQYKGMVSDEAILKCLGLALDGSSAQQELDGSLLALQARLPADGQVPSSDLDTPTIGSQAGTPSGSHGGYGPAAAAGAFASAHLPRLGSGGSGGSGSGSGSGSGALNTPVAHASQGGAAAGGCQAAQHASAAGSQSAARAESSLSMAAPSSSTPSMLGRDLSDADPADALTRLRTAAALWELDYEEIQPIRKIGEGSFGEVELGVFRGTKVAVKRLRTLDEDCSSGVSTEGARIRPTDVSRTQAAFKQFFEREIAILASIRHPNVVNFIGACHRPPNRCLVTEYCARGSLDQLLHKSGSPLDLPKRVEFAMDIVRGMLCLHSQRPAIIHRDLKTANLLVSARWDVKVADFGLSRIKDASQLQVSRAGLEGTVEYCAPEVLRGENYSEKCDVWSFGVVLWELLTRQRPYSDNEVPIFLLVVNIGAGELTLPPVPEEEATPGLSQLLQECLAFEPQQRPSFEEVLKVLEAEYRILRSRPSGPPSAATSAGASKPDSPASTRACTPQPQGTGFNGPAAAAAAAGGGSSRVGNPWSSDTLGDGAGSHDPYSWQWQAEQQQQQQARGLQQQHVQPLSLQQHLQQQLAAQEAATPPPVGRHVLGGGDFPSPGSSYQQPPWQQGRGQPHHPYHHHQHHRSTPDGMDALGVGPAAAAVGAAVAATMVSALTAASSQQPMQQQQHDMQQQQMWSGALAAWGSAASQALPGQHSFNSTTDGSGGTCGGTAAASPTDRWLHTPVRGGVCSTPVPTRGAGGQQGGGGMGSHTGRPASACKQRQLSRTRSLPGPASRCWVSDDELDVLQGQVLHEPPLAVDDDGRHVLFRADTQSGGPYYQHHHPHHHHHPHDYHHHQQQQPHQHQQQFGFHPMGPSSSSGVGAPLSRSSRPLMVPTPPPGPRPGNHWPTAFGSVDPVVMSGGAMFGGPAGPPPSTLNTMGSGGSSSSRWQEQGAQPQQQQQQQHHVGSPSAASQLSSSPGMMMWAIAGAVAAASAARRPSTGGGSSSVQPTAAPLSRCSSAASSWVGSPTLSPATSLAAPQAPSGAPGGQLGPPHLPQRHPGMAHLRPRSASGQRSPLRDRSTSPCRGDFNPLQPPLRYPSPGSSTLLQRGDSRGPPSGGSSPRFAHGSGAGCHPFGDGHGHLPMRHTSSRLSIQGSYELPAETPGVGGSHLQGAAGGCAGAAVAAAAAGPRRGSLLRNGSNRCASPFAAAQAQGGSSGGSSVENTPLAGGLRNAMAQRRLLPPAGATATAAAAGAPAAGGAGAGSSGWAAGAHASPFQAAAGAGWALSSPFSNAACHTIEESPGDAPLASAASAAGDTGVAGGSSAGAAGTPPVGGLTAALLHQREEGGAEEGSSRPVPAAASAGAPGAAADAPTRQPASSTYVSPFAQFQS